MFVITVLFSNVIYTYMIYMYHKLYAIYNTEHSTIYFI
jgi:hypothetical protein